MLVRNVSIMERFVKASKDHKKSGGLKDDMTASMFAAVSLVGLQNMIDQLFSLSLSYDFKNQIRGKTVWNLSERFSQPELRF